MTKVLACVDVSVYAISVADHAAWAARRMDASVSILHVIGRKERGDLLDLSGALGVDANAQLLDSLARIDEESAKLAQERGRALLDTSRARLTEQGVAEVNVKFRHGSFVDTVAECEEDVSLIVIGKRGASADFAQMHIGSNLERVVRSAKRPILVASREWKGISRVLLAYDGGPSARKALEYMASKPLFGGLEVHVVTVGDDTPANRQRLEDATRVLGDRGEAVVSKLIPGDPTKAIGDYVRAEGIDLLAIGAYGHSAVRNLLVGSTTSAMIRTCLIPLMLFR
ncbi:universal stress protein [Pleomorphomonas sp. JP5]|uniref:universal stress protein n=1 Tax=Pleomorphomonas sp. JP5 TaxID=2942998 RepID=UPI0020444819|nr:universal stress protein [Pleomorphomonas sp. JP5]MCM5557722.1 universal stress protein [Pleomorphomonas sp. JP5]